MPADPKTKRIDADKKQWADLQAQILQPGQKCACGCGRRAESLHHLIGKGQRGDDVYENLVPLAGDGTRLCHGALTSGNRTSDLNGNMIDPADVRRGIRRNLTIHHLKHVVDKKSVDWLNRYYPMGDS